MNREPWVDGACGLRGPRYLVQLAEWRIGSHQAAWEEGLFATDEQEPVVAMLLLAAVARQGRSWMKRWLSSRAVVSDVIKAFWDRKSEYSEELAVYVCLCQGLKESDVQDAGRAGSVTPEALISALGLAEPKCCGRCAREIDRLVLLATRAANPSHDRSHDVSPGVSAI